MKKTIIGIMVVMSFVQMACHKEESNQTDWGNRVVSIQNNGKLVGTTYFYLSIGHDGTKCSGCVYRHGQWVHENCQGFGNLCSTSASVTLQQVGTDITATTTDTFGLTSLDFFNMPARSLSTGESGNNAYLNIPAQLVERDTATLQVTFTGLFYTNKPEYNNF